MTDYTLPPQLTLVAGMTGSGKTTFVNAYLKAERAAACRFIFDDLNRMWPRLAIPACYTLAQLEASLPSRWIAFNPLKLFPGDTKAALKWWCRWVFHCASRGPGKKMVVIPEVWRHCNPDTIPAELALLAQAGRELNVELIVDTQRPELVNGSITGAATELVCFKLIAGEALRAVEKLWADAGVACDRGKISALSLGQFLALNRLTGGTLAGRVF
ncbi:MAG: KAP family NTPase [Verrucomicrobia bacterium]|nr:KAP family NTPase [Verrucomicrobiota bacterium]